MALERKEIGKIKKLRKTGLMCMDEGKRAVAGLGGTHRSEQTQYSLGRKSQKRWMLKQAWEGSLVKYCKSLQKSSTHNKSKKETSRQTLRQSNNAWRI